MSMSVWIEMERGRDGEEERGRNGEVGSCIWLSVVRCLLSVVF
jgi:hypothetical protein